MTHNAIPPDLAAAAEQMHREAAEARERIPPGPRAGAAALSEFSASAVATGPRPSNDTQL